MKSLTTGVTPPFMQLHENRKDEVRSFKMEIIGKVNTFSVSQIFLRYACIINTR